MKKRIYFITVTCMVALMFMCMGATESSEAAGDPVKIWRIVNDENLLNTTMTVGASTGAGISYKLDGITEKSHTWSVGDSSICTISGSGSGSVIAVIGKKEGNTKLILTVEATDGKTYQDYAYVSVFTPLESASGKTTKQTMARRSAHAGSDNRNERGSLPSGTSLSVTGQCGSYYRVNADYNFTDGVVGKEAYVLKSDVTIPVKSIILNKTNITLKAGAQDKLSATVLPAITTASKTVSYTSDNKNIVTVYKDGAVYAKKAGTTAITAKCGNATAKCTVNVTSSDKITAGSSKKIKVKITKKYRFSFLNSSDAFGDTYRLNKTLRDILAKKLVAAGYISGFKKARRAVDEMLESPWNGSCYGMAVTTALNKKRQINVRVYVKGKGKGYQMNRIGKPIDKRSVAYIINYYHASQAGYNDNVDKKYYCVDAKSAMRKVVKNSKKGYVQNFGILMEEKTFPYKNTGGHQLLLFKYSKKKSTKNWHAIESYDCTYSTGKRYVYIHKKYNKIKVPGWTELYNIYAFRYSTDFGRYEKVRIY